MNKKELIFNAVIELINKEGLHSNITISSIAKKANIGKGTVYEYFESKEEVISETIIYFIENKIIKSIETMDLNALSFEKNIKEYIRKSIRTLKKEALICNIIKKEDMDFNFSPRIKRKMKQEMLRVRELYIKNMTQLIKIGREEKLISNPTQFEITSVLNLMVSNIIEYVHTPNANEEEFINNLYNLIIKILK